MPNYKEKLTHLIEQLVSQGASDLHLSVGVQPIIRVSGALTPCFRKKS
jgi:Tfp pilus assembly pilus retraction ATPase PilT